VTYPPAPELWVRGAQLAGDVLRWLLPARARGPAPLQELAPVLATLSVPGHGDRGAILQEAERIVAGTTQIFGADVPLRPLDETWHCDWITGQMMPRGFQRWIRLPAIRARGDIKRVWEINRHRWLIRLGQASQLTNGDPRFAAAARGLLASWIRANPANHGVNWYDALEIGVRLIAWWTALPLFGPAVQQWPEWPDVMRAMDAQIRSIEAHLSYFSSPNTHLLGEGLALFLAGIVCARQPRASTWRTRGLEILTAELERQVGADGGHREKSSYYHCYALEMFLVATVAGRGAGVRFDDRWVARVGRMVDVLKALIQPDGSLSRIGDDDGGRLLPLAASDYYRPRDLLAMAEGAENQRQLSGWLDEMSIGTARTSRDTDAAWCSLQGAPLGMLNAGHSHAGLGSVEISLAGQPLIVDPGTYSYHDVEWRDGLRRADTHNGVTIAGLEPFFPAGPFRMSDRGIVRVVSGRAVPGEPVSLELRYALHCDGDVVEHKRQILLLGPDRAVVHDYIAPRDGKWPVTWHWHLAADCRAVADGPASFEIMSAGRRVARVRMDGPGVAGEVRRAWLSPQYGRKEPGDVLVFQALTQSPASFVCELTRLV